MFFSTLKLLQESERSAENGNTFPDPVKIPSASPAQATINETVFSIKSTPLISFWSRTFYRTWILQLLSHSIKLMIGTLCPISTLKQQLTNLEQTNIRVLFIANDGKQKEVILRQLCIFSENLPTGRTSGGNSCYCWRVEWSLEVGAMNGVPPFVMKCSCF